MRAGGRGGAIDLTGKRNGHLVAIRDVGTNKHNSRLWLCECDCGNTRTLAAGLFYHTEHCGAGCLLREETVKKYDRRSVELKPGRTYEEFILLKNQDVVYPRICEYLSIDFDTARDIYDKVSHLDIDEVGTIRTAKTVKNRRESE